MHVPELVSNGPDIQPELLNVLDDKGAVFFCGAGISVGTGLPSFSGLVCHLYAELRQSATETEKSHLCLGQLDKALGLLERRLSDRSALRAKTIQRLSAPATGDLALHKALLSLSETKNSRARLVTTNFDNRFIEAGACEDWLDVSPRLPIPKRHNWESLVHLHGRIDDQNQGRNLVLTGADFGRAYLSEAWAARFVTELFREFTVVFVGYSLNDPVMGYLVDAIAAEREHGAGGFKQPFAFAELLPEGQPATTALWRSKGVEPIIYNPVDNHRLLTETFVEWARVTDDPLGRRTSIALEGVKNHPYGSHDPLAKRVVWALSYPRVAEALAKTQPITDDSQFPTFIAWLDIFYDAGLLGRIEPPNAAPIVASGDEATNPPAWAPETHHLARWIARHLHSPQLVGWVLRRGGALHPKMRDEVRARLLRNGPGDPDLGPELRLYWQILSAPPYHPPRVHRLADLLLAAQSDGERATIESEIFQALTPILVLRRGLDAEAHSLYFADPGDSKLTPLQECACLEINLAGHSHLIDDLVKRLSDNSNFLSKNAARLTALVERAIELQAIAQRQDGGAFFYPPSIADHAQNQHKKTWTRLITLARDGYAALAECNRAQADHLIRTWLLNGHALFRRLALHVVATDEGCDIRIAEEILLSHEHAGLWDAELWHEVAVFLRTAATRLDHDSRNRLIAAVIKGPPSNDDMVTDVKRRIRDHKIWIRLEKLSYSGSGLTEAANSVRLDVAQRHNFQPSADDSDEFIRWIGKGWWGAPGEDVPAELKQLKPCQVAQSFMRTEVPLDDWDKYAQFNPRRAFLVLAILGRRGVWPASHLQLALRAVWKTTEPRNIRLDRRIAGLLLRAPAKIFQQAGLAIAGWLEATAITWLPEVFSQLWFNTWNASPAKDDNVSIDDNVLTTAINRSAGKLAEAALRRLWARDPERNSGLTDDEKRFFDAIVDGSAAGQDFGRVVLARVLWNLHAIDRTWVKDRLLPLFQWTSPEAKHLWQAYAWNPRLGPNLLADARPLLLETFKRASELGVKSDEITRAFASLTIHAPDVLTSEEIADVVTGLDEDGLSTILRTFTELCAGPNDERAKVWDHNIQPWIAAYWPTGVEQNTAKTAAALADLVIETGAAFPRALKTIRPHLKPIMEAWQIVHKLNNDRKAVYQDYPLETLELLDAIIESTSPWLNGELTTLLNNIAAISSDYRSDNRWQKLMRISQK
jgi:hypothetical protein